ncbi:hypothetical protein TA5113_03038 [Cognatishimia activa]|nr:hypothetical protein TA5113_03038 [Cognatishimia activa]
MTRCRKLFLKGVEDFRTHADRFFHVRCRNRHDHEFLDVDWVICVLATVDDVHHWNRQNARLRATDVAIEWLSGEIRCGFRASQRHAKDCVCTKTTFVVCAVEFDHRSINGFLFGHIKANQVFGDLTVHGGHCFQNTFAKIAGFVAVALFDCFVGTGGCARRHGRAAHGAVFQDNINLNGWVAAAV